jgi:hypothetical protein
MTDKRAWKILKDIHWESSGWRDEYQVPTGDDYDYALKAGYIIEDRSLTWNEITDWAKELLEAISPQDVGNGFLVSLLGSNLALRSALGAHAMLSKIDLETRQKGAWDAPSDIYGNVQGVNAYNFTLANFCRHMWGSILNPSIPDMCFCLEKFQEEGCPEVTEEHLNVMRDMIRAIEDLPDDSKPHDLEKALKSILKSNQQQRAELIMTFGYADILTPKSEDVAKDRSVPIRYNYSGPVEAWLAVDGYNKAIFSRYFPKVMELLDT